MKLARSLALVLLVLTAAVAVVGPMAEHNGPAFTAEQLVRSFFRSLEGGDAEQALAAINPPARERWREFVENSLYNEYRIRGVAIRETSFLEWLRGGSLGPREVTVFLTVTEAVSGAEWQAAPKIGVTEERGQLYLARPPLA